MEINLKNIEIITAIQSASELVKLELPPKTSWNIAKNIKKLESIFNIYTKCERELIQKYAIKDEKGEVRVDDDNKYKIIPKYISKFNEDRNELLNCDNTVDVHLIKLSELCKEDKDGNTREISPAVFINLYFMIEDDPE